MNHARRSFAALGAIFITAGISMVGCASVQQALAPASPTPTATATSTPTFTPTLTLTPSTTPTNTPTRTPTAIPTDTATPLPTATSTPTVPPTLTAQEEEQVAQLIAQLKSGDQDTVENAHAQLMGFLDQLSKNDIVAIVQIMRSPGVTWQKEVGKTEHCTDYSKRSTPWYAAFIITFLEMDKSPYVDAALGSEAGSVLSQSDTTFRVTQPGWT